MRGRTTQDEFPVDRRPDPKAVFADLLEAVARVEALGAVIFRPDADPELTWAVAFEPGHDFAEQAPAGSAALEGLQQIESLQLARARADIRMRQIAGAGQGVSNRSAGRLHQPQRAIGADEIGANPVFAVGFVEKVAQIPRRVEMRERLAEGAPTQLGQGAKVAKAGAAYHRWLHSDAGHG